ncbi:MAG TPA: diaminopimelate decarboxylase, partial [Gammaproteobacteria bacterium]|nr:diaminopimelate decarboxylase [Gammaproteobacteria bacterium]
MPAFAYSNGRLCADGVILADVAERFGTPCYIYSRGEIEQRWYEFDNAFSGMDHLVCYAVKANSNLAVLNVLAKLGSGFDIVSGGELERVITAGGDPARVVFSGVGKCREEMAFALEQGIKCFNVESTAELQRLENIAASMDYRARISMRVNPDVDAGTHPYIATGLRENKFGIPHAEALDCYRAAAQLPHIDIVGIDCHIGSQIISLDPFMDALSKLAQLIDAMETEGIHLAHVDIGGGLGIHYRDETPPAIEDFARVVLQSLEGRKLQLLLEPGRSIMGNAGVLLTRVEYLKHTQEKNFAIVDAAMNDLMRPSLYDAWHDILPLDENSATEEDRTIYDIVG